MSITVVTNKTLADFESQTPELDKEVPIYDSEGEIKHFWRGQVYGAIVVVTTRKPGKHPKVVEIKQWDGLDAAHYAERYVVTTAQEREKRVPVLRKEKAEAKLLKMIQESKTDMLKLAAWAVRSNCVMYKTHDEIWEDYKTYEHIRDRDESKMLSAITEHLRKEGDSYFGGLKLAKLFIEQIKPDGLADQALAGVIQTVEQNLVPWPYVAGYLRRPVMDANDPRELAVRLIEKHAGVQNDGMGFYKEGTTAEGLVKQVYKRFVEDIKPDVLDALTLD